jgi:oligoribonuclease NrnB/cAMP/cGMP phosphodiesterase (DHH superfamily)
MWKADVCIHHHPCDDGFAAAWVARRKWPEVVIIGTNYGQAFPDVDIAGKNVLIADFSYPPDVLSTLAQRASSIVVLDHHKTGQSNLAGFTVELGEEERFDAARADRELSRLATLNRPAIAAHFDMQRSGASLTWNFCFPDEPAPIFIRLIEDRDLWRMSLPETRAFSLFLKSYPYELDRWSWIADAISRTPDQVLAEAKAIERFYDRRIGEILHTATLKTIGRWKDIPVVHAPYAFGSDLANALLSAYPSAPFAAVVVDAYGARSYMLRSDDNRQDVSEVARTFGGGGHRNAASFRVPA